ncbi:hypothetical protein [Streptomyces sp. NPDC088725]|uniref:hypothetical protein n=1 Tax=Streptomyces sp. NPDC088725 TaxID=3365873 RepID=UPI003801B09B
MRALRIASAALGLAAASVLLGVGSASATALAGHEGPEGHGVGQATHAEVGDISYGSFSFAAVN